MSEIGAMKNALEGPPAAGIKPTPGIGGAGYAPTADRLGGGSGEGPQGLGSQGLIAGTRNRPMLLSEIMARG